MILKRPGKAVGIAWGALIVLAATPAVAHIIAPQYAVFDSGALRVVLELQVLAPLLALGVALGRGSAPAGAISGALWAVCFAIGAFFWNSPDNPFAGFGTPMAFLTAGAALMTGGRWGAAIGALAAVAIGAYAGGIGRQEDPLAGVPGWFTLGIGVGAGLVVFFAAEGARVYRPGWATIPVRIAASWLLAIGLMFLGLVLRPQPPETPTSTAAVASSAPDTSPCPGPHRHGPDGEMICLRVPKIDKAGTPSAIARYGNQPPPLDEALPARRAGEGGAAP